MDTGSQAFRIPRTRTWGVFRYADSHEFTNLWDHPDYAEVKERLLKTAVDAAVFAADLGPGRIGDF
ncbi:MAG: hypothetical protein CMI18_00475 [Opitutaceae bacterium]|nr:hypothetical protein [Opitutaceae bacterium]